MAAVLLTLALAATLPAGAWAAPAGTGDATFFPQPVPFELWNVSMDEEEDEFPDLFPAGDHLGLVWSREFEDPTSYQLVMRRMTRGSWSPESHASLPDPAAAFNGSPRWLNLNAVGATFKGLVYVAWASNDPLYTSGADHDVLLRALDPATSTWGEVVSVTPGSTSEDRLPSIAVMGDRLVIAWVTNRPGAGGGDDDVVLRTYDGAAFSGVVDVSTGDDGVKDWAPDIAVVGGRLGIAWERNNVTERVDDYDVMYAEWDGDAITTPPTLVSTVPSRVDRSARVGEVASRPFVVWESYPGPGGLGGPSILGRSMGPAPAHDVVNITRPGAGPMNVQPALVSAGGVGYVVWTTFDDALSHGADADVVMRSYDGTSLGAVVELSDPDDGNASDGHVTACIFKGNIYAAWTRATGDDPAHPELEVVCRRVTTYVADVMVISQDGPSEGENVTVEAHVRNFMGGAAQDDSTLRISIEHNGGLQTFGIFVQLEDGVLTMNWLVEEGNYRFVVNEPQTSHYERGPEIGSATINLWPTEDGTDGSESTVYIVVTVIALAAGAVGAYLASRKR
jgi:hypothetical protein